MRPIFHPHLVNGPSGDPALYLDFLFERRALLFDLGDIHRLSNRKLLRISDIFISHTHMDHFIGFDHLLRVCLGRETRIRLFGPTGFIGQVEHKLAGYTWNLVERYENDFTLVVTEVWDPTSALYAEFHVRQAFRREMEQRVRLQDGLLVDEEQFTVRCALLEHRVPSLGFALQERRHVNVWKNRLAELNLPVGPWLRELKAAVLRDAPDETPIAVPGGEKGPGGGRILPLGALRRAVGSAAGQKIAYIADCGYSDENRARILGLAQNAALLFIEACFLHQDARLAEEKRHLTAPQAGELARLAGATQTIPFHFSARYEGQQHLLQEEVRRARQGH